MKPNDSERFQEQSIAQWRSHMLSQSMVQTDDVDELEDHLRSEMASLAEGGLAPDEAFLIAVKRIGHQDAVTQEYATAHTDRLWKQFVGRPDDRSGTSLRKEVMVVLGLAIAAAAAVKAPDILNVWQDVAGESIRVRNASVFVFPFLVAYFAWKRSLSVKTCCSLGGVFVAGAIVANIFPLVPDGSMAVLTALHMPIAMWPAVGIAYTGGRWIGSDDRMHFVRFTGELPIYFVLIALGGGALTGITGMMFSLLGVNMDHIGEYWVLPCGAVGGFIVAAALVERKRSVVENMGPVLARIFTPLLSLALLGFLVTMLWTGNALDLERQALIAFDMVLVVVLCLLLYTVSARDSGAPPGAFDWLTLGLVGLALSVDAFALAAIAARILEWGSSANKMAALGENLVLLSNLAWSAWLYLRFLRGRGPFHSIKRWQMAYLPVYVAWAAVVVVVFPLVFGYA